MIQQSLKMIWTERKVNAWIILELMLVFIVMWFCSDYLSFMVQRYIQPKGFDISHTYRLNFDTKDEYKERFNYLQAKQEYDTLATEFAEYGKKIAQQLKQLPFVEHVCYSYAALPYGGALSQMGCKVDTVYQTVFYRKVDTEYFNVYKINVDKRNIYDWDNNPLTQQVVISADKNDTFAQKPISDIAKVIINEEELVVGGIASIIKFSDYHNYAPVLFSPIERYITIPSWAELCIRVKPDADNDFITHFNREIQDKLDIGPFSYVAISSMEDQKDWFIQAYGFADNFKNIISIIVFVIANVFLGIFGTFWFRTQRRKSELGLRRAVGSSKQKVKLLIFSESMLMLLLASIPAATIALVFTHFGVVDKLGIPSVNHAANQLGVVYMLAIYLATFGLLALMVFIGAYLPAKQASSIDPAIVLRATE